MTIGKESRQWGVVMLGMGRLTRGGLDASGVYGAITLAFIFPDYVIPGLHERGTGAW